MRKLLAHAQTPAVSIRELRNDVTQELAATNRPSHGEEFQTIASMNLRSSVSALEGFVAGSDLSQLIKSIDIPPSYGGPPPISTEAAAN